MRRWRPRGRRGVAAGGAGREETKMTESEKHARRLAAVKVAEDAMHAEGHLVHFELNSFDERYVTAFDEETGDAIATVFFPEFA